MAIASDQISIATSAQSMSTLITPNVATTNIPSSATLGSNAAQKIIVMSPSQAGQVQVVQQPPQAPHPPTSQ